MLDIIFIILGSYLQIIYVNNSIVIANIFKLSKPPIYLTYYHRYIILKS